MIKIEIDTMNPVAVRKGQSKVYGPQHDTWPTKVTCDGCDAEYVIGPHRIYASRTTEEECVKQLKEILAGEHAANHPHQDAYKLEG